MKKLIAPAVDRLARALAWRYETGRGLPLPALATKDGRRFPELFWGLNGRVDELRLQVDELRAEVDEQRRDIAESRRLNQRLTDVLDVVTEVLVPAVDRDDERIREALARLDRTVNVKPDAAGTGSTVQADAEEDGGVGSTS